MNKKEKELMDILRVPSFKRINRTTNKYIEGAKRLCKGFNDAAISARDFERALTEMNKLMPSIKR